MEELIIKLVEKKWGEIVQEANGGKAEEPPPPEKSEKEEGEEPAQESQSTLKDTPTGEQVVKEAGS